ncbi:hypothetical protein [Candidatus Solincola sp.]|nr:hypothetical protein [Actinomycetota bacterium]
MARMGGLMEKVTMRLIRNRWGYTPEELEKARRTGLLDAISVRDMFYWIKAEPVYSRHCMGQNYEGRPLYFDAMGGLIRRKSPATICVHGLSQLSPVIYSYYDHMLRGRDPNDMVFHTVACTDPGLEQGGLGRCVFRVSRERMPFLEAVRGMLRLLPYLFITDRRQRGRDRAFKDSAGERDAATCAPAPSSDLPLSPEEMEVFLSRPERVMRLRAMERFRDLRVVLRVVEAVGCPAGHVSGDEVVLDSVGRVLRRETGKDPCIMALHKAWFRVMLLLERMAQGVEEEPEFSGTLFDIPISCYGDAWPRGACGRILMRAEVRSKASG